MVRARSLSWSGALAGARSRTGGSGTTLAAKKTLPLSRAWPVTEAARTARTGRARARALTVGSRAILLGVSASAEPEDEKEDMAAELAVCSLWETKRERGAVGGSKAGKRPPVLVSFAMKRDVDGVYCAASTARTVSSLFSDPHCRVLLTNKGVLRCNRGGLSSCCAGNQTVSACFLSQISRWIERDEGGDLAREERPQDETRRVVRCAVEMRATSARPT